MRLFLQPDQAPCPRSRSSSSISDRASRRHATLRTPSKARRQPTRSTEAERRADQARYQEVTCRPALNRVQGMPIRLDAEPLPRLHARLPLLLRAPLPRPVRDERRRRVRVGDSGEAATSSRSLTRASSIVRRGRASTSRSAPRPTRTSRSRATTSSRGIAIEALARGDADRAHHQGTDGRARPRRPAPSSRARRAAPST